MSTGGWALLEVSRDETQARSCSRGSQSCCSSRGVEQRTKSSQCGGRQSDELEGRQDGLGDCGRMGVGLLKPASGDSLDNEQR